MIIQTFNALLPATVKHEPSMAPVHHGPLGLGPVVQLGRGQVPDQSQVQRIGLQNATSDFRERRVFVGGYELPETGLVPVALHLEEHLQQGLRANCLHRIHKF